MTVETSDNEPKDEAVVDLEKKLDASSATTWKRLSLDKDDVKGWEFGTPPGPIELRNNSTKTKKKTDVRVRQRGSGRREREMALIIE
jgi:hypothetical protein